MEKSRLFESAFCWELEWDAPLAYHGGKYRSFILAIMLQDLRHNTIRFYHILFIIVEVSIYEGLRTHKTSTQHHRNIACIVYSLPNATIPWTWNCRNWEETRGGLTAFLLNTLQSFIIFWQSLCIQSAQEWHVSMGSCLHNFLALICILDFGLPVCLAIMNGHVDFLPY